MVVCAVYLTVGAIGLAGKFLSGDIVAQPANDMVVGTGRSNLRVKVECWLLRKVGHIHELQKTDKERVCTD